MSYQARIRRAAAVALRGQRDSNRVEPLLSTVGPLVAEEHLSTERPHQPQCPSYDNASPLSAVKLAPLREA